jgi:hypothetical protein
MRSSSEPPWTQQNQGRIGFGVILRLAPLDTLSASIRSSQIARTRAHFAHASALSRAFPFSGEKLSQAKRGSPKVVDLKVSRTAGVVSKDWL